MKVIGFNFTKISANRDVKFKSFEKIISNLKFLDVETDTLEIMKEAEIVKITFEFSIEYEPKRAELHFEGVIPLSLDKEAKDKILETWKDKKLDESIKVPLFNLILNKCSLKALQLEEELGLPTHIKLPRVNTSKPQNSTQDKNQESKE